MVLRCVGNISTHFSQVSIWTHTHRKKILEYTRLENIYPISLHGPVPSVHVHMFSLIYIHQPFKGYIHKSVCPFVILKHCWKVAFVLIVCFKWLWFNQSFYEASSVWTNQALFIPPRHDFRTKFPLHATILQQTLSIGALKLILSLISNTEITLGPDLFVGRRTNYSNK